MKRLILHKISHTASRSALLVAVLTVAVFGAVGCAVQESNTYPIEIFSEMHYSQAQRMQEPPRLAPVDDAVPFVQIGTDQVLDVPERVTRDYDVARAKDLYRVNCSVCHGTSGVGDGPAAVHITSADSYWATTNDDPYLAPANLIEKRESYDQDAMVNLVTNGIVVMPRFGNLLAEEEIREIVDYIYDQNTGIGH